MIRPPQGGSERKDEENKSRNDSHSSWLGHKQPTASDDLNGAKAKRQPKPLDL
jgi:hypothetical protein